MHIINLRRFGQDKKEREKQALFDGRGKTFGVALHDAWWNNNVLGKKVYYTSLFSILVDVLFLADDATPGEVRYQMAR